MQQQKEAPDTVALRMAQRYADLGGLNIQQKILLKETALMQKNGIMII